MALQLGALRDALKEAGASDQAARGAAEEVAAYENRLGGVEQELVGLRADIDRRFAAVDLRFAELRAELVQRFTEMRAEMDRRFAELRAYVDQRFTTIEGRLNLLGRMVGTLSAVQIALLLRLLFVH